MKKYSPLVFLPLLVWVIVSCLVLAYPEVHTASNQGIETPVTLSSVSSANGFEKHFDKSTSQWTWTYSYEAHDGCERLVFTDQPVTVSSEDVITIQLRIHSQGGVCSLPAGKIQARGHIEASSSSTFKVLLDGSQVYPIL